MTEDDARLREEAAAWLAKLRAPQGEQERDRFEAWRRASLEHATAYARVEGHWRSSGILAGSELRYSAPLSKPWWRAFGGDATSRLALGCVAALALMLAAWNFLQKPAAEESIRVASVIGQLRTVTLADGSQVTLDSDTTMFVNFSSRERRLLLEHGRARFTVAHDKSRRFIVVAGKMVVVAHGTIFDVDARAGESGVTLIEGAVDVMTYPHQEPVQRVALRAGSMVTAAARTARLSAPRPAQAGSTGWTSGMLSFASAPLDQVVADANRYTTQKLVLADPALARLRVTGAFPAAAPRELAVSLSRMFSLNIVVRPDGEIVLAPTPLTPRIAEGG